jgi:membrane fusion protein, multidrug efflux system
MSKSSSKVPMIVGALGIVGIGAIVFFGLVPKVNRQRALARTQVEREGPRPVRVAKVIAAPSKGEIVLPGTATPRESTLLYPRSIGFVRRNYVDVGDIVKAGQQLADINAPETDEDVRLAVARLEEAEANIHIADRNAARNGDLADAGVVSKQQADDLRAQANSASAAVKTRKAELSRLGTLRGYQRIIAPFDGVVTERNMDRGALVGSASGGGPALFEVAAVDLLRIFVDVPQTIAADVKPGLEAIVYAPNAPTQTAKGSVVRMSGVLEPTTRTMHVEVNIPGGGPILPGSFVYVRLTVPRANAGALIPASTLIVRKEGTLVARASEGHVKLVPVQLGRDLGKQIEILSGVSIGESLVVNPADDLAEGAAIQVVEEPHDGGA